jgi:hypothetical protein
MTVPLFVIMPTEPGETTLMAAPPLLLWKLIRPALLMNDAGVPLTMTAPIPELTVIVPALVLLRLSPVKSVYGGGGDPPSDTEVLFV